MIENEQQRSTHKLAQEGNLASANHNWSCRCTISSTHKNQTAKHNTIVL